MAGFTRCFPAFGHQGGLVRNVLSTFNHDEGPWGPSKSPGAVPPNSGSASSKDTSPKKSEVGGDPFDPQVLLKNVQGFFRNPPWGGKSSGRGVWLAVAVAGLLWVSTGVYKVQPNEQGVVLRFGRVDRIAVPGLNYHWPYPIETVLVQDVTAVNRIDSTSVNSRYGREHDQQSMLSGDENIVEVQFTVLWRIRDVVHYLFRAKAANNTILCAAESVVREIIAQMPMSSVLTEGRTSINRKAQEELQRLVDQYGLGVQIDDVIMGRIDPPPTVIDAYRDVQRAKADQQRLINEAQAYRNSRVPVARGEVQQIIQQAKGYAAEIVAGAQGDASRFLMVQKEYREFPEAVRQRLYVKAMQEVLGKSRVTLVDKELAGKSNFFMPLGQLPRSGGRSGSTTMPRSSTSPGPQRLASQNNQDAPQGQEEGTPSDE